MKKLLVVLGLLILFLALSPGKVAAATWDPMLYWDFEGHTASHADLDGMTVDQIQEEMMAVNTAFTLHGFNPPQHMAYPNGWDDELVESIVSEYTRSGREVTPGINKYPIGDWYELHGVLISESKSWSSLQGYIDQTIATKGLLHLYTHDVKPSPSQYGCTPEQLTQVLDYLKQQQDAGQLQVVPIAQAYDIWSSATSNPPATVVISFDDAAETDYTIVYPLFQERSLIGTSYIPTDWVGEEGHLTWDEMAEMRNGLNVPSLPTADFISNRTSGDLPLSVQFSDTSIVTRPTGWFWDFGDNTTAITRNPSHLYTTDGSYTIRHSVTNASGTTWKDMTDDITAPSLPANTITVTVPNGGESWHEGSVQTIRWNYTGNPGSMVKIELLKGTGVNQVITTGTSIGSEGAGSYNWTIPDNQVAGSDYKIRVTSTSNGTYTCTSNSYSIISTVIQLFNGIIPFIMYIWLILVAFTLLGIAWYIGT